MGSENMVLTKKLDALEEFRIQREQLMAKFEEQETKVEEQKQFYETQIYEQVLMGRIVPRVRSKSLFFSTDSHP